jgi:hypothetical protein
VISETQLYLPSIYIECIFSEKLAEIEVPEFKGDSFLVLPVSDNLSTQTNIEVWFLTKASNGKYLLCVCHTWCMGGNVSPQKQVIYVSNI